MTFVNSAFASSVFRNSTKTVIFAEVASSVLRVMKRYSVPLLLYRLETEVGVPKGKG